MKSLFCTTLFLVFCISVCPKVSAQDNQMDRKMPVIELVSEIDIVEKVDEKPMRSSTLMITHGPEGFSPPHRHPGAVYGYIMEGEFEFKVEGKPLQLLKAGDTFYEPTMILHEISRNPSQTSKVRILAVIVHPRDAKQLIIPEKKDKAQN